MQTPAVRVTDDPLAMQPLVHLLCRWFIDSEACSPGGAIGVVAIAPAFRAGAVPGSEGDCFIVEIQEGVVVRLPLLMPATAKLERAGDPEIARVKADDLVARMENAAVARPGTPEWDGFDVTHWRHTISCWSHVVSSARRPAHDLPSSSK